MTSAGTQIDFAPRAEPQLAWRVAGKTGDVAHRELGPSRDLVLVHGLAMSGAYFIRFAGALFRRGWSPIAPDIPGFGRSDDAPAGGPVEHAKVLIAWAEALGIRDAVWVGHSASCNVVARIARIRPDLVRAAVFIGPLWTRRGRAQIRMLGRLVLDGFREPLEIYHFCAKSFFRAGFALWWATWRRFATDLDGPPPLPRPALFLAGRRDPLPDRTCVPLVEVGGAHACFLSCPDETAAAVDGWSRSLVEDSSPQAASRIEFA